MSLPQYQNTVIPMRGTTIRITEKQLNNLDRLKQATNSPSVSSALRLFINAELKAIDKGHRNPEDFIPTTGKKNHSVSFKMSDTERENLIRAQYFYGAKNYSQLLCYIIDRYGEQLDTEERK